MASKPIPEDIKYTRTDGGKRLLKEYGDEKNDCSVRALAIAYNIGYSEAHQHLESIGNKYSEKLTPEKTLKRVMKEYPVGRYIIRCRGHVMPLIDGVLYDYGFIGANKRITHIWRIS